MIKLLQTIVVLIAFQNILVMVFIGIKLFQLKQEGKFKRK